MPSKVKAIPGEYPGITPYLIVKGAAQAMEFYKRAFGAREIMRFDQPDGRVGHAEMQIGDARFMLADEFPEMKILSPQTLGGSGTGLLFYVENVDEVFNRAVAAGARAVRAGDVLAPGALRLSRNSLRAALCARRALRGQAVPMRRAL